MNQFWERVLNVAAGLRGRSFGVLVGVILGLLYLVFGFWKVIIFAGFVAFGYYLGRIWEGNEDWRDVVERILPPK
ncbi:MAG: hypothetical protein JWN30_1211 [Bacilli bacterium]|nr:hypothetical protein [Bacilli bacterium]